MAKKMNRREFLGSAVKGAVAAYAASGILSAAEEGVKIVRVESPNVWLGDKRDPGKVAEMVHRGVMAFTGQETPQKAWMSVLKPYLQRKRNLKVGLKINLLGRPLAYTAQEVTNAVVEGVRSVGLPSSNIIAWDRYRGHFGATVYNIGSEGNCVVEACEDYENSIRMQGKGGSAPINKMAATGTDVTINLPVAKDHGGAGVTLALKNIGFGCYNHRTYNGAHGNSCDPYIPEACKHYITVNPIPVIILDATEGTFNGGPAPKSKNFLWRENAVYVASDPVALDTVVRKLIMDVRQQKGMSDKTRQCHHIETAAEMGLGVNDLNKIEVQTVKV